MLSTNYVKLKTNLRLCIQRLKLMNKKKYELAQKSRKEISEYLLTNKLERAKIRVEHIIREDYLVEAMELVEMYCDLLITRFGLIQQLKTLDEGLAEAISSLLWVAPRLQTDISEMKIVYELLTQKYGKQYAQAARDGTLTTISKKLKAKMAIEAPPKILIEKYLIEIAKASNIDYEPDKNIMDQELNEATGPACSLIDLEYPENFDLPSIIPSKNQKDENIIRPIGFDIKNPNKELENLHIQNENNQLKNSPPPHYDTLISNDNKFDKLNNSYYIPKNLPNTIPYPSNKEKNETISRKNSDDDIDFEDLSKRFEALKNRSN